ncbi:MAG: hypothetical protein IKY90_00755 [Oscillospiraceae bacterium]|nr:hypothetical protein [Oscillospiraceae bacterium]
MNNNSMFQMHILQKEQQLREMEAELIALQNEYYKILNSKFWKSTQWMRNLINKFRPAKAVQSTAQSFFPQDHTEFVHRIGIDKMLEQLLKYDIVSFDIFDTLILRNCRNPVDVFDIVSLKTGFESFSSLRIDAEKHAREITSNEDKEVSLEQIYNILKEWTSFDMEKAMLREIETEKALCVANPYMKQIFDTLRATDKKIIITTDMYLPADVIKMMLNECGYFGYDNLFVSNETGLSKASGKLYKYISGLYPEQTIIHVGDNYISDVLNSDNNGWKSLYYPSCKKISDFHNTSASSPAGNIYSGLVENKLFSGVYNHSIGYRHGYAYGGILTIGYCNWLKKFAQDNKADKILFLARDAEIFETIFRNHIDGISHQYMIVSRFAMWQIVFDLHTEEYIKFFFKTRSLAANSNMADALQETGLSFLLEKLEDNQLSPDTIIDQNTYSSVRDFIYKYKKIISAEFAPMREAAEKYFNYCFGDAKKIVLSDVGWSGQILLQMRHFVHEVMGRNDIEIIGAYLATSMRKDVNHYVNSGVLNSYLYNYGQNRDMYMPIDNFAGNTAVMCLEAMFSSTSPTLMSYRLDKKGNYDFVYGDETGVYDTLNDIQHGIIDFSKDWFSQIEKIGISLAVSPADAFSPYESVAMSWQYLEQVFGNFTEYVDSIPRLGKSRLSLPLRQIMYDRALL